MTLLTLTDEAAEAHIRDMALALLKDAELYHVVLTIEQVPLHPLAMGHHRSMVGVRRARELATPRIVTGWSDE